MAYQIPGRARQKSSGHSYAPASLSARFWALLIDYGCILGVLNLPAAAILYVPRIWALIILLFCTIMVPTYWMSLHAAWSRSLGKLLMGLKVVTRDGQNLSEHQAVIRYLPDAILSLAVSLPSMMLIMSMSDASFGQVDWKTWTEMLGNYSTIASYSQFIIWGWFVLNAVPSLLPGPGSSLRDYLAGTRVVALEYQTIGVSRGILSFILVLGLLGSLAIMLGRMFASDGVLLCGLGIYVVMAMIIAGQASDVWVDLR